MTNTMRTLTGIGVSPGSAIGPVAVVRPTPAPTRDRTLLGGSTTGPDKGCG